MSDPSLFLPPLNCPHLPPHPLFTSPPRQPFSLRPHTRSLFGARLPEVELAARFASSPTRQGRKQVGMQISHLPSCASANRNGAKTGGGMRGWAGVGLSVCVFVQGCVRAHA